MDLKNNVYHSRSFDEGWDKNVLDKMETSTYNPPKMWSEAP